VKRSICAAALLLAIALAVPPTAGALIQLDRGIAGVRLNNTKAEVRAALGKPKRIVNGMNDFGPFTRFDYRGRIRVIFQGQKRVTSVTTSGLGDRTARGVGVGSTEKAVNRRTPGVKCETFIGGIRSCHTGSFSAGTRVTDFRIRKGRVRRVTVAFVID
jgi:hypothetical protein